jgi:hypothetical protein
VYFYTDAPADHGDAERMAPLLLTLAALGAGAIAALTAAVLRRRHRARRRRLADDGTRAASLPGVNDTLDQ